MSRLLMDDPPLVVQPALAVAVGLNEAIVLQQLHYWLEENKRKSQTFINDRFWTYNSITKWLEQFPFWSDAGLRKIVNRLKKLGLVETAHLSKDTRDRTLYYTINYEALHLLLEDKSICYAVADASPTSVANVYKEQRLPTEITTETKDIAPRKKTRDGLGEAYEVFKKIWNQDKPELSPLLADNQEVRTRLRPELKRLGLEELLRRAAAALVFVQTDRFSSTERPCTPITLLRHLDTYAEQGQAIRTQKPQQAKPRHPTAQEIVAEARRKAGI